MLSPIRGRYFLPAALFALALASCERPSELSSPSLKRQMATGDLATVRFVVTRADNAAPVAGATVSVWFNNTQTNDMVACGAAAPGQNCWLTTDANGVADVATVEGATIGYLARFAENWVQQANDVWPPATPPATTGANADLGALTCARNAPVVANAGTIQTCFTNLYLTPRKSLVQVDLALPVVQSQNVTIVDLDAQVINTAVYAHLIEALPQGVFPWLNDLPSQVLPGFLRYYGPGDVATLPKIPGVLEVYGKSSKGYDVAASGLIGTGGATLTALPVVCTNPNLPLAEYTLDGAMANRPQNSEFNFPDGKWVFGAQRVLGSANALEPNLTTTVVALETFQTTAATVTVDFSQRFRPSAGSTWTASGTATCTLAGCTVVSVNSPGAGNPMNPTLSYEPGTKRLFWVVTGLNDPLGASEWSVKATRQQGSRTIVLDQWPNPSKKTASSAFQLFSDALKTAFCDPRAEWSYDGSWGCGV